MVRIALAPCSPFSVTPELMTATAELAERLDVRLHTHLAEDPDEDRYAAERFGKRTIEHFEDVGWMSDRVVGGPLHLPRRRPRSAGSAPPGSGVAHCPSSNMMIGGGGIAPVADLRAAGVPVGLGCDGSASTDSASLWLEARSALLLGRMRGGPGLDRRSGRARDRHARVGRLPRAGGRARRARGRRGRRPRVLAAGGDRRSPVRCPTRSRRGCGAGRWPPATPSSPARPVVRDGELTAAGVEDVLRRHRVASERLQAD